MINDTELEYEESNIPANVPVEELAQPKQPTNNYKNLVDLILNSKLKKPALYFKNVAAFNTDLITASTVKISRAPNTGKNANHIYLNINKDYYGKINPKGEFFYSKYNIFSPIPESVIKEFLENLSIDPKQALIENGKASGRCCCCNQVLTDPKSIELGIGPICIETWGL